ncbi:MAG: hypothetical protein LAT67_00810 [Balneolales bacterium]|nr:hypothetical protein [Balneolales bacterium]
MGERERGRVGDSMRGRLIRWVNMTDDRRRRTGVGVGNILKFLTLAGIFPNGGGRLVQAVLPVSIKIK